MRFLVKMVNICADAIAPCGFRAVEFANLVKKTMLFL